MKVKDWKPVEQAVLKLVDEEKPLPYLTLRDTTARLFPKISPDEIIEVIMTLVNDGKLKKDGYPGNITKSPKVEPEEVHGYRINEGMITTFEGMKKLHDGTINAWFARNKEYEEQIYRLKQHMHILAMYAHENHVAAGQQVRVDKCTHRDCVKMRELYTEGIL